MYKYPSFRKNYKLEKNAPFHKNEVKLTEFPSSKPNSIVVCFIGCIFTQNHT